MPTRKYKPEQIVTLLWLIEMETAQGKSTLRACRDARITVQTFYRWQRQHGRLELKGDKQFSGNRGGA